MSMEIDLDVIEQSARAEIAARAKYNAAPVSSDEEHVARTQWSHAIYAHQIETKPDVVLALIGHIRSLKETLARASSFAYGRGALGYAEDFIRAAEEQICFSMSLPTAKHSCAIQRDRTCAMKIIRKSNYDHEDHRGDQYFVAQHLCNGDAQKVADLLNALAGPHSDDYYLVVSDDYVLPPDWEP